MFFFFFFSAGNNQSSHLFVDTKLGLIELLLLYMKCDSGAVTVHKHQRK